MTGTGTAGGPPEAVRRAGRAAGGRDGTGDTVAVLERVTDSGTGWLHARTAAFRLPDDVTRPGTDHNATLKPLGELARFGALLAAMPGAAVRTRRLAGDLLDFAWRETRQGELFVELAHAEPHATHPLELYAPFAEAGRRNPRFEELTRRRVRTRSWRATELEPTRLLAVLRAEESLGMRPHEDPAAVMRRSWLGALPEPWAFEGRSGYAFTHYVFHVTHWGGAPARLPAEVRAYLTLWLPAWLDGCLEEERWDLAGELLATAACLPVPVPAAAEWRRLADAQGASGALAEDGPAPDDDSRETFLGCYHATLVAAYAAALTAARLRGAEPPERQEPPEERRATEQQTTDQQTTEPAGRAQPEPPHAPALSSGEHA